MLWQELERRAPDLMRKSIVTVDVLADGPERIADKVTGCFANPDASLPELGVGTAEEDVVLQVRSRNGMECVRGGASAQRVSE
jgi:hypothetical protein